MYRALCTEGTNAGLFLHSMALFGHVDRVWTFSCASTLLSSQSGPLLFYNEMCTLRWFFQQNTERIWIHSREMGGLSREADIPYHFRVLLTYADPIFHHLVFKNSSVYRHDKKISATCHPPIETFEETWNSFIHIWVTIYIWETQKYWPLISELNSIVTNEPIWWTL